MNDSNCPICDKPMFAFPGSKNILYCRTITINQFFHCSRTIINGSISYTLRIPPFTIDWWASGPTEGIVFVHDTRSGNCLYQNTNLTQEQVMNLYERFKNLRPFI